MVQLAHVYIRSSTALCSRDRRGIASEIAFVFVSNRDRELLSVPEDRRPDADGQEWPHDRRGVEGGVREGIRHEGVHRCAGAQSTFFKVIEHGT